MILEISGNFCDIFLIISDNICFVQNLSRAYKILKASNVLWCNKRHSFTMISSIFFNEWIFVLINKVWAVNLIFYMKYTIQLTRVFYTWQIDMLQNAFETLNQTIIRSFKKSKKYETKNNYEKSLFWWLYCRNVMYFSL